MWPPSRQTTGFTPLGRYITAHGRLWPAYLMRHGPFLARLVFSNEKACVRHNYLVGYVFCNGNPIDIRTTAICEPPMSTMFHEAYIGLPFLMHPSCPQLASGFSLSAKGAV